MKIDKNSKPNREKYLWKDLTTLLAIYDKDDTLITRYFYANKQTPYKMTHKGKTYYLSYNHQGSLKTITDTNQTIVKEILYNPYGKILKDTNSSLQININYAGGLYDKDTNLIKFGKRDYDPNTKRWTAKDPIDFSGGDFNLYRYVMNDPVNYVDREGEIAWFVAYPILEAGILASAGAYGGYQLGKTLSDWWNDNTNDIGECGSGVYSADGFDPKAWGKPLKKGNQKQPGYLNPEDGSVWEQDNARHRGPGWKRWKNKRDWTQGIKREGTYDETGRRIAD